jgi:hypothetical protein
MTTRVKRGFWIPVDRLILSVTSLSPLSLSLWCLSLQWPGVDYDETFCPVVKPATIHTVLSLVISRSWHIHQLDVKNTFLHGTSSEIVYCSQSMRFVDPTQSD